MKGHCLCGVLETGRYAGEIHLSVGLEEFEGRADDA